MGDRENSIVFQPGYIGNLKIKNRLVRSATFENAASNSGKTTEELLQIYRSLAEGGVGLIITGISGVYTQAIMPKQVRFDEDRFIPELKKIPKAVHEVSSDCRIMAQLNHPGRQVSDPDNPGPFISHASPALLTVIKKQLQETVGGQEVHHKIEPTAPSDIFDKFFQRTPRALTVEEIEKIINAFSNAIRRAAEARFDGVQLHAAHGWLLSSFLSPYTNNREDIYGGSSEKRASVHPGL
jgi:2,4-dienoyl-CoA reductase-like NADH-dependent reductase (Old Yellow Enzyme family)